MPASYRAPIRADKDKNRTSSQTTETNMMQDMGTVARLIAGKGGDVISIRPQDNLTRAVEILRDKRIGALVVTDETGSLQGILSERDIVRKLAETPGQTLPQSVSENMTAKVVTCSPSDTLVDVLKRMTEGRFRHMPVLEEGRLVALISLGDVVSYRLQEVRAERDALTGMVMGH